MVNPLAAQQQHRKKDSLAGIKMSMYDSRWPFVHRSCTLCMYNNIMCLCEYIFS